MRILVLLALLAVLGCVALPLSALVLDGSETGEDLIVPVQVVVTAAVGAVLARPVLGGHGPTVRTALTGAALGLVGAAIGLAVFFLLLNGTDGA